MLEIIAIGWSDYRKSYCMVIQDGKNLTRWAIDRVRAEALSEFYSLELTAVDDYFPDYKIEELGL